MTTPRIVYVPGRGTVALHSTDDPETWFAESTTVGGKHYRIGGVGTGTPFCICPARKDCVHLLAAMLMVQEDQMTEELPEAVGQSTAVAIAPRNITNLDARRAAVNGSQTIALSARANVDGYKESLYLGAAFFEAGLVPQGIKTPQQAAIVMLRAQELGIPVTSAFEHLFIVGNKIGVMGQMVAALIDRSGLGYVEVVESTEERATVRGHRTGRPMQEVTWTKADALKAGSKEMGGWKDKLVWKATARIGRRMFADVLGGMDVGDGAGVVIDEGIVPAQEGEYRATVDAPAPEPPAPKAQMPWGPDLKAALKDSPVTPATLRAYFDIPTNDALNDCIDAWLDQLEGRTPRALVSAVADWDAAGRPARTAPPAPAEDAQEALFTEVEE